jgi:diguanylate cyclase (GGDEF)-like protein
VRFIPKWDLACHGGAMETERRASVISIPEVKGRPKVLVVDDDEDLRHLAEMQLSEGFDVLQAASGPDCVEMAREHSPDVILLDMMMPGMDGSQVLDQLSKDASTRDIPVIFLSALSETADRVAGLEQGAVDFISKPANPTEFVARVGAAARTRARSERLLRTPTGDPLTGLADRKAFEERLGQEVSRCRRMSSTLSILIIDIDQMDRVNDALGRDAGDELLTRIAESVKDTLRTSDIVFRYGGDELSAILPESEAGSAYLAAERVREVVRGLMPETGGVSVSIGIAELAAGRTIEELQAKAEIALFRAKESGGDRSWRADDPRRHGLNPIALSEELTEREWSVLVHLADKRTEQDIARRMGIQPGTVRSHKARIRRKLHVSPDVRLSDFVRENFSDLIARLGPIEQSGTDV